MAIKPPVKNRLYKIPEAAQVWAVPASILYDEIAAGRLRAKMRRGNMRGYMVTEQVMDDWIENCMVDVFDAKHPEFAS